MGKLPNRLQAFLLTLCIFIQANAYDFKVDGIYYNILSETNCEVTNQGSYNAYSGDIVIPASVENEGKIYQVVGIGEKAFVACAKLGYVTLPGTIEYIAQEAFCESNLRMITFLPNDDGSYKVKYFGIKAFELCKNLAEIKVPSSVKTICESAFSDCTDLNEVQFSEGLEEILGSAFSGCKRIYEIKCPNSLKVISNHVFSGCTNLQSIDFGNSLEQLGDGDANGYVFYGCKNLYSFQLPPSLRFIGASTFTGTNWWNLSSDGLLYKDGWLVGAKNFDNKYAVIEDGTIGIAQSTFYYASSLQYITLPESTKYICNNIFFYSPRIAEIQCLATTPPISPSGNLFHENIYNNAKLIVPEGSKSLYAKSELWAPFFANDDGILDTFVDEFGLEIVGRQLILKDCNSPIQIFDSSGKVVFDGKANHINLQSAGTYILRVKQKNLKFIIK